MNKIKKMWYLLTSNPTLFLKYIAIKTTRVFLPLPKSPRYKSINGVIFEFDFNYDPCMKQMYLGFYELFEMEIVKKNLREGDTFIDVGANVGYVTAVAAGRVGKTGQVHSFEPIPEYFQRLQELANINTKFKIIVNQCALGEDEGTETIYMTNLPNIGWNTMIRGFMSKETQKKSIQVPVIRLDKYIKEKKLSNIKLIKIDTEGFELFILKGLEGFFINTNSRPMILVEIAPGAYPLLGCQMSDLFDFMQKYSYLPFHIYDTDRKLDPTSLKKTTNILFRPSI